MGLPAAQLTPGIQNTHLKGGISRQITAGKLVNIAELLTDLGNALNKLRKLQSQRNIAAITHPV